MPVKPRKIPMRMCVGCREMKPKKELLRQEMPDLPEGNGQVIADAYEDYEAPDIDIRNLDDDIE